MFLLMCELEVCCCTPLTCSCGAQKRPRVVSPSISRTTTLNHGSWLQGDSARRSACRTSHSQPTQPLPGQIFIYQPTEATLPRWFYTKPLFTAIFNFINGFFSVEHFITFDETLFFEQVDSVYEYTLGGLWCGDFKEHHIGNPYVLPKQVCRQPSAG